MKFLALGGAVGPLLFAAVVVVCGVLHHSRYDQSTQLISELGATGVQHAHLMNFAGFVPSGLALLGLGASLAGLVPRSTSSLIGAMLVGLLGAGIAAAGIFSCDPGCPLRGASLESNIHHGAALVAFISGIAAMAVWAHCFRRLPAWRDLWLYSAISSAMALFFLLTTFASIESRTLTGLWQRLSLGTLYLWCAVTGTRIFLTARPVPRAVLQAKEKAEQHVEE